MDISTKALIAERSSMHQKVTAIVIVINNVKAIGRCLESLSKLSLSRIIIVDGGSTDGTIEIANSFDAELHVIPRNGVAQARQYGLDLVQTEFVLLVDSDNIIEMAAMEKVLEYFLKHQFVGVAFAKRSFDKEGYFGMFQEWMNDHTINKPGEKLVIGGPALYRTAILKQIRYDEKMSHADDTDLCFRLRNAGYFVGTSDASIKEIMPVTLTDFIKRAYRYGVSDSQFFKKHPSRRLSIGTHVLRNYFARLLFKTLSLRNIKYFPLFVLYSIVRIGGLYVNLLRKSKPTRGW